MELTRTTIQQAASAADAAGFPAIAAQLRTAPTWSSAEQNIMRCANICARLANCIGAGVADHENDPIAVEIRTPGTPLDIVQEIIQLSESRIVGVYANREQADYRLAEIAHLVAQL